MKLDKKYTVLDYLINQLKYSKLLGKIIIATTNLEEDNAIVNFAKKNEINLVNLYQDFKSDDKRKFIFNNFIFGDIHWNKAGNIRILKALIREIDILRKN